jgi:hypothetical protein
VEADAVPAHQAKKLQSDALAERGFSIHAA